MSTLAPAVGRRPGREAEKGTRTLTDRLGFRPAATPLIMVLGLVFLMATLPRLFVLLADAELGPDYVHVALVFVRDMAEQWSWSLAELSVGDVGRLTMQAGVVAVPTLWLAAAFRSVRARTWRPLTVTVIASSLGIVGIPIITWIVEVLTFVWWVGGYIAESSVS